MEKARSLPTLKVSKAICKRSEGISRKEDMDCLPVELSGGYRA